MALLEAPGMFPIRLKIHRPKQGGVGRESMDAGGEYWEGGGEGGGLEGSLSRLKQVKHIKCLFLFVNSLCVGREGCVKSCFIWWREL